MRVPQQARGTVCRAIVGSATPVRTKGSTTGAFFDRARRTSENRHANPARSGSRVSGVFFVSGAGRSSTGRDTGFRLAGGASAQEFMHRCVLEPARPRRMVGQRAPATDLWPPSPDIPTPPSHLRAPSLARRRPQSHDSDKQVLVPIPLQSPRPDSLRLARALATAEPPACA